MAKSVPGGFEEEETLYIRSSMEQQQQLCFLVRGEGEGFSTSWVTRFSTRASVLHFQYYVRSSSPLSNLVLKISDPQSGEGTKREHRSTATF